MSFTVLKIKEDNLSETAWYGGDSPELFWLLMEFPSWTSWIYSPFSAVPEHSVPHSSPDGEGLVFVMWDRKLILLTLVSVLRPLA